MGDKASTGGLVETWSELVKMRMVDRLENGCNFVDESLVLIHEVPCILNRFGWLLCCVRLDFLFLQHRLLILLLLGFQLFLWVDFTKLLQLQIV